MSSTEAREKKWRTCQQAETLLAEEKIFIAERTIRRWLDDGLVNGTPAGGGLKQRRRKVDVDSVKAHYFKVANVDKEDTVAK